jgi:hypothetical protein
MRTFLTPLLGAGASSSQPTAAWAAREAAAAAKAAAGAAQAAAAAAQHVAAGAAHPAPDPLAFYDVAATILPVLFLALIYQANFLENSPWRLVRAEIDNLFRSPRLRASAKWMLGPNEAMLIACVLLYGVFGEFYAMHVLSTGRPSHEAKPIIGLALYLCGVTLVVQSLLKMAEARAVRLGTGRSRTQAVRMSLACMALLSGGMLVYALKAI